MKRRYTQKSWQLEMSKAPDASARRELLQSLTRGDVEVTDDNGRPLDFAPPPDRLGSSALSPSSHRDSDASFAKLSAAPVTKSFSLGDRAAFEDCIANEPIMKKVELRMWFDQQRKENGID